MADVGAGEKLKVFISYSRKDSAAFADELLAGLEVAGFAPFLDRHDIEPGEPWEARLGGLIAQSDTVVFVVSPEAVKSERCRWEVDRTIELSKRLLPVIFKSVPDHDIPEKLRRLHSCASTARRDLRGRCRSSPRHCGWTLIGFASTPGLGSSRGAGTHAGAVNRCFCAETTSMQQKHGSLKGHTNSVNSAAFSGDGKQVVTADGKRVVTGSSNKTARIWDAESGTEIGVLKGHDVEVVSAAFSGDGKLVVTAAFFDNARIWNAESRKEIAILKDHLVSSA